MHARSTACRPRTTARSHWSAKLERLAASPGTAAKLFRMHSDTDVRRGPAVIQAPTLVLHRPGDKFIDIRHSRYIAEHIPGAQLVELPGERHAPLRPRQRAAARRDRGVPHRRPPRARPRADPGYGDVLRHRRLDAPGGRDGGSPVARSARVDRRLDRPGARALPRPRGQEDGRRLPRHVRRARAGIRCAAAIRDAAREEFGLEVRSGLHTGEIELIGDDVGGIAVHIGARVARPRRARGGAGVGHGQGPSGGIGHRVRRPRRARAQGSPGRVAAVGGGAPSAAWPQRAVRQNDPDTRRERRGPDDRRTLSAADLA